MCLCFGSLSRDSRVELLELVGGMDLIMAHELSMRDRRQAGRQAGRQDTSRIEEDSSKWREGGRADQQSITSYFKIPQLESVKSKVCVWRSLLKCCFNVSMHAHLTAHSCEICDCGLQLLHNSQRFLEPHVRPDSL